MMNVTLFHAEYCHLFVNINILEFCSGMQLSNLEAV